MQLQFLSSQTPGSGPSYTGTLPAPGSSLVALLPWLMDTLLVPKSLS